ncbi:DNA-directed RNA polymerase subunit beta', partial [Polymorphobacter sp.]|uniref:DNA-directed RNA polymerase subunit beta' n=1 Tax=Polymorphobacter sp. TaxID=1909290 RepID=UPI003F72C74F
EAQLEARVLMMSTNNILSPANGKPIIVPSQDMVLGLYYLSMESEKEPGEGMAFSGMAEVHQALHAKVVTLHSKIRARVSTTNEAGETVLRRVETTPGRMLLGECLPKSHKVPYETINRLLTKKEIGDVIDTVYRHTGQKETVLFADAIMTLGFRHAFQAGISFGKDDMVIPAAKAVLVDKTKLEVKDFEQQYQDGLITQGEKYNKVVDAWAKCGDQVAGEMMKEISAKKKTADGREAQINSIYMMAHSGARGSQAQMKQLAGMRGLMAKPSGEIIETPIISNFKEGLTVLEYFNSTHGARKGLADTALKTANSGYLTRRLVDVSQDCVVIEQDCTTELGLVMKAIVEGGNTIVSLGERILGRTVLEDIIDAKTGEVIAPAGRLLDEADITRIETAAVAEVKIRSPLLCETKGGVCATCYGRDLARGTPVNAGEAVGVIAAQSIGEPGTQLTMRTFHIGGAAQVSEQSSLDAPVDGIIEFRVLPTITDSRGRAIAMARNGELVLRDEDGRERSVHRIPYGAALTVVEGVTVKKGDRLADWDPYTLPVITEKSGKVKYQDLIEGVSLREEVDETTGISNKVVSDWKAVNKKDDLRPRVTLLNEESGETARYPLAVDAILSVADGQDVFAGDVIARIPREAAKTRDITGGLPRVAELFEARIPKDNAIIARIDGRVEFGKDYKTKRRISIRPEDGGELAEYLVPKGKHVAVQEGDFVRRGDYLIDGNPNPHDILEVLGVEPLAEYLCTEIQEVYRLQGVRINDKHIEVIVRQMLQKVEITVSGDTTLLVGEQVDREEMDAENAKLDKKGTPAEGKPVLLGITKASLQTKSFISAASFQETTRVLTEAAVQGKVDTLQGLKENVIVGRLIPAGTGAGMARLRVAANSRDAALRAAQASKAEAAIEAPAEA